MEKIKNGQNDLEEVKAALLPKESYAVVTEKVRGLVESLVQKKLSDTPDQEIVRKFFELLARFHNQDKSKTKVELYKAKNGLGYEEGLSNRAIGEKIALMLNLEKPLNESTVRDRVFDVVIFLRKELKNEYSPRSQSSQFRALEQVPNPNNLKHRTPKRERE